MLKRKTRKQLVVEGIGSIWFFLALVSTIVLIVLNCTSIYKYVIDEYNLTFITGLSEDRLMLNYKTIVSYLQKTGGEELELPDFPMSEMGIIHFADVKNIFITLYIITLLFIFALGVYSVIKHRDKNHCILSIFNKGANLVFLVFSFLIFLITFNFSNTFTVFHKIFFRNDYWLFDYRTDPIILALPEQLFMILSIIITVILFLVCIIIKIIYYKLGKNNIKALRQT